MKTIILAIITAITTLFLAEKSFAQNSGSIAGNIKTNHEVPATVTLINAADSATVKTIATNKQGNFEFSNLAHGKYRLLVTAVGFQKRQSPVLELNAQRSSIQLPPISLAPATAQLQGVTVTAQRPMIEQRLDRTILNVDAAITNAGSSALEILEKAPGVSVDREGNISLKGKEGVLVLIDGRPTQLAGADLANMLRNMTSIQLDQIEIMTNPPARYDAAGNSGIINFKTKKLLNKGYNGNATVSYMQGRYPKTNEGFNFNYREQKINLSAGLSHNFKQGFEETINSRTIRNNEGAVTNYFDQHGHKKLHGNAFNGSIGLDYFPTPKTTLGFALNAGSAAINVVNKNTSDILGVSKDLQSTNTAIVDNQNNWRRYTGNAYIRTVLNNKGREISADVDFIHHQSNFNLHMTNGYTYSANGGTTAPEVIEGRLPQYIKVFSGRIDYIHPLGKAKLEAGLKASVVNTDNDVRYDSIQNGATVPDYNRSNHFVYRENINAAYLNLVQPFSKQLSMQVGLRVENTNTNGRQLTKQKSFDRHYTQLFPTVYLQYNVNDKNSITANFGRRVQRPGYQSLNPFTRFIDRYTYSEGNPELLPAISNNVELSHSYKNIITTTLNYSFTNNIINTVVEQKGSEALSRPMNIASLQQFGIAINANNKINNWWNSNINFNAFNNRYQGVANNAVVNLSRTSFILMTTQQFKINKSLSAELSGRVRSGWLEGIIEAEPVAFVWAGLSKQVLKNQGTIKLTVRDIFHSQVFKASGRYGHTDFRMQETNDTRMAILSFSYRFSKGKKIAPVKRSIGSAGEEKERIGE